MENEQDQGLANMEKEIARIKKEINLQAQLDELKAMKGGSVQSQLPDPMQRLLRYAMPAGLTIAAIGLVFFMFLHDWSLGLTLDGIGAILIAVKIGLTPAPAKKSDPSAAAPKTEVNGPKTIG